MQTVVVRPVCEDFLTVAYQQQDLLLLGKAIGALREQHDLNPRDLAVAAGVAEVAIDALEDGRLDPDFEMLLAIAERMGLRPSAFFLRAEELRGQSEEG
jgi:transcriptional regulator with XRE-family HTH domain